ncbi:Amino Acid-Polyamine-Organocation (APC) Family [Phytophthora palmivora]|uniref:Amino Acid-Polyamine-Organocation (APC) Family n=1 Tax=Phytophthora palmivora TaxID=4796 RepID=A0A2P4WZU4_9STRA|nr:Amino Acid-Polyamine-Organocation (APC) Family [Phytophthora palmivora]
MSVKVPFKFEEFYEAFGKSVSSDVIFADGQIHIVPREKEPQSVNTKTSADSAPTLPVIDSEGPIRKHAKGRLLDSADRRRLPWSIRALLEAQEPDGSWIYSSSFEFIINSTAPPPMDGISGKLWATAIAITVWRQFPEYFELLETNYEKAMLHADENVLRIVRSVLQFDALDQIRPYKSDEARAIREKLAREAAEKRELELSEELKVTRMREEEVRIGKLCVVHARRLPMVTQQLFVSELGNEITKVFSALPPVLTHEREDIDPFLSTFKVGQLVESCRRRRSNSSALAIVKTPSRWHLCRITAVDEQSRLLQLDFLDGSCERERRVPMKFVRATAAGAHEIREAEFETLKSSWSEPIVCKAEIARLEEARAVKLRPLPWDDRHHLMLQDPITCEDEGPTQEKIVRASSSQRPRSSTRRPISRKESRENVDRPADKLFDTVISVLLLYDRAYTRVQETAQIGAKRYAASMLYRDRFNAFDEFFDELADSIVALVERTLDALEAIWKWKHSDVSGNSPKSFIWNGSDFITTLVRSLDFLGSHRELVEWYGEEFPLDGNPFMRASSLLDKAEERGLQPATMLHHGASTLRAALKLHKRSDDSASPPTWWPEARYSRELVRRIDLTEQVKCRLYILL